jgi:WD40 repeat protein
MANSDSDWLRRAERAECARLLSRALSAEDVLLYDASGKPIRKTSDLFVLGEIEARRHAHQFLDELLRKLPPEKIPTSPEELLDALRKLYQSDPKYSFNIIDGKLSLPFSATVRGVLIKGHIPLYGLCKALIATIAGLLVFKKLTRDKPDDAISFVLLAKFEGHTGGVRCATFSPDSQRIVTASEDRTARVWNSANGQLLAKLEGTRSLSVGWGFHPTVSVSSLPAMTKRRGCGMRPTAACWSSSETTGLLSVGQRFRRTAYTSSPLATVQRSGY